MTTISKIKDRLAEEREKLEASIWELTEWRGKPETVDRLMSAIDAYASVKADFLRTSEPARSRAEAVVIAELEAEVVAAAIEAHQASTTTATVVPATLPVGGATRVCKACGLPKAYSDYNRDRSRSDGYMSKCKKCVKNKVPIPKS